MKAKRFRAVADARTRLEGVVFQMDKTRDNLYKENMNCLAQHVGEMRVEVYEAICKLNKMLSDE